MIEENLFVICYLNKKYSNAIKYGALDILRTFIILCVHVYLHIKTLHAKVRRQLYCKGRVEIFASGILFPRSNFYKVLPSIILPPYLS